MPGLNGLIAVALLYVAFLFAVAFWADRGARAGRVRWSRSALIYTLSLSIYCTAWTFYGAVGSAARSGLEFVPIYLGPTLVMVGWWWVLRKLVQVGRSMRVTSIADLVSARFGKSRALAALVTVLAVLGTTPYIALQLQSVTLSTEVFADAADPTDLNATALWVAVGLAVFTILFGTRTLDSSERHHGIVMAIAIEAVVKLAALLAVGIFVVWGLSGGVGATLDRIDASPLSDWSPSGGRWVALTMLAAAAFLTLPRMFQVLVVENTDERHLATASWAFPLYLLAMSLFVLPIAVIGLERMPAGANPDLFVLTLPLSEGREGLAIFAYLGGFSSATSMVIVAAIALATMVSNHIVLPIWLARQGGQGAMVSGDVREVLLNARRLSIIGVLALGYLYFRLSGGGAALAAIGIVSFAGMAQVLPTLLGALFWRAATRVGAAAGLMSGFVIWAWTLFLPSFGDGTVLSPSVMAEGPFGIGWLRPEALFGIEGLDPLVHSVFWSLFLNALAFFIGSILSFPRPLERAQGVAFVTIGAQGPGARGTAPGAAAAEDLLVMSQRLLGPVEAQTFFQRAAEAQGKAGYLPDVTPAFLDTLERELAGSVGAATAHAMLGQFAGQQGVSVEDLMAVADEAAQIMEYSARLEAKSVEQERTARALREANAKLTALSVQKDAFLSQISHELRTPMTSIRSFSELLREEGISGEDRVRFAGIIHDEAQRLTRLLDDLLDLSVLENGQVTLNIAEGTLGAVIDRAVAASGHVLDRLKIRRVPTDEAVPVRTDLDRLAQGFINLLSNAAKYCDADVPEVEIRVRTVAGRTVVDVVDNGSGIPPESQGMIFEKFSRLEDAQKAGGAGLGLAICREGMMRLGGAIAFLPGQGGAAFRVTLPESEALAAE